MKINNIWQKINYNLITMEIMVFDTVIIGAGAMGSATAYWLSKYQNVALIEQFDLLHHNGSSHGESRVIRKTYRENHFSDMMNEAYTLWNDVQNETKKQVYWKIGGLDLGIEGNIDLKKTIKVCEDRELNHQILDAGELRAKYPAYSKIDDDYSAIYQEDTGILNASKSVDMFQRQAMRQGCQVIPNSPVLSIKDSGELKIIETLGNTYYAKKVIVTTGSWMNKLVNSLGYELALKIWKLSFGYYKVKDFNHFIPKNFPVFIHWGNDYDYGFPMHEKNGYVKIAPHDNKLIEKLDFNDGKNNVNQELINHVSNFIDNTFTGIDTSNPLIETCLYTMTENENFMIDYFPDDDNIILAGGFSGHGFKFTPLIGKILQEMTIEGESRFHLNEFKLNNFIT